MSAPLTHWLVYLLAIGSSVTGLTNLWAQSRLAPTHRNVPYDKQHDAQRMDVYLAEATGKPLPTMIFFHGGGWRGGSKQGVPSWLIDGV